MFVICFKGRNVDKDLMSRLKPNTNQKASGGPPRRREKGTPNGRAEKARTVYLDGSDNRDITDGTLTPSWGKRSSTTNLTSEYYNYYNLLMTHYLYYLMLDVVL